VARTGSVEIQSKLEAPAATVWDHVATFTGINDELGPYLRMTAPAHLSGLGAADLRLGQRLGRSWLLVLVVLPVEFDDVVLVELEHGRRFLERSRMGSLRVWQHERVVEPDGAGSCVVTDRLRFEPRVGAALPLVRRIVAALFGHRHRRLRRRFGGGPR
jgi:ligand-binding SRPBCC domain-containing protein